LFLFAVSSTLAVENLSFIKTNTSQATDIDYINLINSTLYLYDNLKMAFFSGGYNSYVIGSFNDRGSTGSVYPTNNRQRTLSVQAVYIINSHPLTELALLSQNKTTGMGFVNCTINVEGLTFIIIV
jgi:hypothetical protein